MNEKNQLNLEELEVVVGGIKDDPIKRRMELIGAGWEMKPDPDRVRNGLRIDELDKGIH